MSGAISLKFEKRDFLYDNGIVTIFLALKKQKQFKNTSSNEIEYKNSKIKLNHQTIEFVGDIKELKEIYFILRENFYSNAFEETENLRVYYDTKTERPIRLPKLNTKPWLPRLKIDKHLYYIPLPEQKIQDLEKRVEQLPSNKKFENQIRHGQKSEVVAYLPPKELGMYNSKKIKSIVEGSEKCVFCDSLYTSYNESGNGKNSFALQSTNLIFDFGTGTSSSPPFRDYRTKEDIPMCFICDLIYKYGLMKNYFVKNRIFIISAPSLQISKKIKEDLDIPDERILENENIRTNFISKQDFMATGAYSLLLLLLHKMYNKIMQRDELSLLHIYSFIVTGEDVQDLNVYNKISYIAEFFDKIKDIKNEDNRLFLHSLINYACYKNIYAHKTKNLPKEEISYRILNGLPIISVLFDLSYHNLSLEKSSSKAKPSRLNADLLYEFLKKYSEVIGMNGMKELHENCMVVGDRIGYFAAESDNKTLLYQLREIGNLEGMTEFFKNLEYEILKKEAGAIWNAKIGGKNETYSDLIHKLLLNIQNNKNVRLITNYLGIYAVQKYLSTKFAKEHDKKSESGGVKK